MKDAARVVRKEKQNPKASRRTKAVPSKTD